jgi:type IV secretory pathway VirB4 component
MSPLDLLLPLRSKKKAPTTATESADAAVLAATIGPAAVEVGPRYVRVGDGYAATLVVTGYPAEVGPAWLEPLLAWPGRLDVTMHIEPIPTADAANRLRRQRARLESSRRIDADKGRLGDPATDVAADDAADLADRLARGQARLFRVGLYLTVHAMTPEELVEAVAEVRSAAASVLLDTHPVTWRQLQGWTTTLPLGVDSVRMRRVFDTDSLAAAFPLASADLPAPLPGDGMPTGGVLYGLNTDSAGIVWWDRWAQHNHNSVVLARSGAGKSYFVKLDVLRSLYEGVQVSVIDPEDEYMRLAAAVGGVTLQLGAPGVRLNPLDLPPGDRRPDALTRRALFLHSLISVLLGQQPPPAERAALDRAIIACYANAGITNDPDTWSHPAPLLRDLTATLSADGDPAAATLAARLTPWVSGSFKDLFDGPTTVAPKGHLVVWSTRQLPDELHAPGMLLALDAIWREVDTSQTGHISTRRLVVVDEAWALLRDGEGAKFLYRLAKAARKRKAGVMVITQDAADLLGSDLGQAVVANAATQILMRQAPQAIDVVADTFGLTGGEARRLLSASRGETLLLSGSHRVSFQSVASKAEHRLAAGLADLVDDNL